MHPIHQPKKVGQTCRFSSLRTESQSTDSNGLRSQARGKTAVKRNWFNFTETATLCSQSGLNCPG